MLGKHGDIGRCTCRDRCQQFLQTLSPGLQRGLHRDMRIRGHEVCDLGVHQGDAITSPVVPHSDRNCLGSSCIFCSNLCCRDGLACRQADPYTSNQCRVKKLTPGQTVLLPHGSLLLEEDLFNLVISPKAW